ncbi:IPT/TIG domain-containing protein [Streptomyces sp. NPDC048710]|uniref:IPT/TIG domain-containing protein n=1 Tax=unclassified Streptomyces TaxID=2593676 RepID=UPI0037236755
MAISISPNQGPQGGGTTITITATVALPLTGITVYVNGTSVAFTRVDSTHITFVLPAGCGVATVYIHTAGGDSNKVPLYYISPPIETAITPSTAAVGSTVAITGYKLLTVTGVTFGGTAATGVSASDDNTISATVPAGTGTVPVDVTTLGGSTDGLNFEYLAGIPTVASITPTSGSAAGGNTVTFTGTNYTSTTGVDFGTGNPATAFAVVNDTTLTATAPAGTGTVDVHVTNPAGTSTDVVTYDYIAGP